MRVIKKEIDLISREFDRFFLSNGYTQEPSVPICSGIDDSVTFIGSGISVLKPYIRNGTIPENGVFIRQKSIRTQALKNIMLADIETEYTSFFDAFCVLLPYSQLQKLVDDALLLFTRSFGIHHEDILFRICGTDTDLLSACASAHIPVRLEIDTRPEPYYCHKYGMDDLSIRGRNLNFAFACNHNGIYKDVGNIIVIEDPQRKLAVELAFGAQPALMRKYDIPHSLQASYVADVVPLDTPEQRKFADALVVTANLEREQVRQTNRRYPVYLYRKYCRALEHWSQVLEIRESSVSLMKKEYLKFEYADI